MLFIRFSTAATLLLASTALYAQVTEVDCDFKIIAVPVTITTAGVWCLDKDLTFSSTATTAISIQSSNVTLDLNSHTLRGPMSGGAVVPGSAYKTGVDVPSVCCTSDPTAQRNNLIIRNGTISGFHTGIIISGNTYGSGYLIEGVQIRDTASVAVSLNGVNDAVVRGNLISRLDAGLCGATSGCGAPAAVYGIGAGNSKGVRIENNTFSGMRGLNGTSYGITMTSSPGTLVEGNSIESVSASNVADVGINIGFSPNSLVVNNKLVKVKTGIAIDTGSSPTYYVRNITIGTTTAYSGGTPKGTENF